MVGDDGLGTGAACDLDHLLNRLNKSDALGTDVAGDNAASLAYYLANLNDLVGGCVCAGGVVDAQIDTLCAFVHALGYHGLHLLHFICGGSAVCQIAHDHITDGAVTCKQDNVAAQTGLFKSLEPVLYRAALFVVLGVFLAAGCVRAAALTADDGGNALQNDVVHVGHLQYAAVTVAVRIDKAGGYGQAGCIDNAGSGGVDFADLDDLSVLDSYVGSVAFFAGAVYYIAVFDDNIKHNFYLFLCFSCILKKRGPKQTHFSSRLPESSCFIYLSVQFSLRFTSATMSRTLTFRSPLSISMISLRAFSVMTALLMRMNFSSIHSKPKPS